MTADGSESERTLRLAEGLKEVKVHVGARPVEKMPGPREPGPEVTEVDDHEHLVAGVDAQRCDAEGGECACWRQL